MSASIIARAIAVLEGNWNRTHTLPATGLYPHQWSWDSAFIAMGLRHVSPRRAGQELDALLAGQWDDGRIPQIIFDPHRDADYSPGSTFWRSSTIPGSPGEVETAGLVQPPNQAWAVWAVHASDPEESNRRNFLARAYPRLLAWHEYLRTRRDRRGSGLACIVHPWESGTDNSPLWDEALSRVSDQPKHRFERPDLLHTNSSERPSDREYGRYFWLAERYRDHDCDDVDPGYPFLVEDPLFNTLYAVSELALARIAKVIGKDPQPHERRSQEITDALGQLFSSRLGCLGAWDVVQDTFVDKATINGVLPLLLPTISHASELIATLEGPRFLGGGTLLPPSYDATAADLEPELYWRGPAWFNMAWLSIIALETHGRAAEAARVSANLVRLAEENDFPEYVNPWTGSPHGTRRFSWTAALTLDTLKHKDRKLLG
jgi:hypothetical protein